MSEQYLHIPLDQIFVDESINARKRILPTDLVTLVDSIKALGLQEPVLVSSKMPGDNCSEPYILVAGYCRFFACRLGKIAEIPAIVKPIPLRDRGLINLVENIQRNNLTIGEEAKGIERLVRLGYSPKEIAQRLGMPEKWALARTMLCKLEPEVQQVALLGNMSQQNVFDIYKMQTPEQRIEAAKVIRNAQEVRPTAKIKVPTAEAIKQKREGVVQRPRSKTEILDVLNWLAVNPLPGGLYMTALAWAAGNISDKEFLDGLENLAVEAGVTFDRPRSMAGVDLTENYSTEV